MEKKDEIIDTGNDGEKNAKMKHKFAEAGENI